MLLIPLLQTDAEISSSAALNVVQLDSNLQNYLHKKRLILTLHHLCFKSTLPDGKVIKTFQCIYPFYDLNVPDTKPPTPPATPSITWRDHAQVDDTPSYLQSSTPHQPTIVVNSFLKLKSNKRVEYVEPYENPGKREFFVSIERWFH